MNRTQPSIIPLGLLSGVSIIGSIGNFVKHRSNPQVLVGFTGGLLMVAIGRSIRENGATKDNLLGAMIGSASMTAVGCELGAKMARVQSSIPLGANLQTLKSAWPLGLTLCAMGSMLYYGNELVARFGPIHRGVVVR